MAADSATRPVAIYFLFGNSMVRGSWCKVKCEQKFSSHICSLHLRSVETLTISDAPTSFPLKRTLKRREGLPSPKRAEEFFHQLSTPPLFKSRTILRTALLPWTHGSPTADWKSYSAFSCLLNYGNLEMCYIAIVNGEISQCWLRKLVRSDDSAPSFALYVS